jgi:hypothetical protein
VQRHLAGLELDVHRACLVERRIIDALGENDIAAVVAQVVEERLAGVRARDHAQAAILARGGIERDPRRAGGERPDRPVVAILVKRRLRVAREIQEIAHPLTPSLPSSRCALTSFSGRTPGLAAIRRSSAPRICSILSIGKRQAGTT